MKIMKKTRNMMKNDYRRLLFFMPLCFHEIICIIIFVFSARKHQNEFFAAKNLVKTLMHKEG